VVSLALARSRVYSQVVVGREDPPLRVAKLREDMEFADAHRRLIGRPSTRTAWFALRKLGPTTFRVAYELLARHPGIHCCTRTSSNLEVSSVRRTSSASTSPNEERFG
jgi:hypothetical protein